MASHRPRGQHHRRATHSSNCHLLTQLAPLGELQKTRNECWAGCPPHAPGARSGLTPITANCLLSDPLEHPTAPCPWMLPPLTCSAGTLLSSSLNPPFPAPAPARLKFHGLRLAFPGKAPSSTVYLLSAHLSILLAGLQALLQAEPQSPALRESWMH